MIYEVVVDIANSEVDKVFDYSYDSDIPVGSRVEVPFGNRKIEGYVVAKKETTNIEVKGILRVFGESVLTAEMLALASYLKENRNLRFIDTIRLCVPPKLRGGKVKELQKGYITLNEDADIPPLRGEKQRQLLQRLIEEGGEYETLLRKEYGSAVNSLLEKGIINKELVTTYRKPRGREIAAKDFVLTKEQSSAVKTILGNGKEFLIHGVTGSGKTEIYINIIKNQLQKGKTAIMLVPEISLTPQMLGIFRGRFGDKVSLLHSGLSDGERFDEWRRLLTGEAVVALGARSAIFAPLENIGVIIMDEEHDNSYVSESNPRYFTRDIARFRCKYNGAKLIYGSATPSMESYKKAMDGEYTLITLDSRVNEQELPEMQVVDMRKEVRVGNAGIFSRALENALEETIKAGNQAMLFVNRRGFASFLRCKECGYVPQCVDCEVSLTYHKGDNRLKCHYCGKQYHNIIECPSCGSKFLKEGKVGTEKVVEEVNYLFPDVKCLRMDTDTTKGKNGYHDILNEFAEGGAQVLVGTQMIAKGHDFKDVTLVGILDADLALYFSDYRSNENTFQLITQVAGRAGRKDKAGKVIMQTYNPSHYVFRFAKEYDYRGFFEKESNVREATQFPPYTVIGRILIQSEDEQKAYKATLEAFNEIKELKKSSENIIKAQAMRAPLTRIKRLYRFQIVVWLKEDSLSGIYEIAKNAKKRSINSFVEINPTQML